MKVRIAELRGLLVRPTGEWLFLALLTLLGANSLYNGFTANQLGEWERSVLVGNIVIGSLAWGIVAASRRVVVGDYRHPRTLTALGAVVALAMAWLGVQTLAHELPALMR